MLSHKIYKELMEDGNKRCLHCYEKHGNPFFKIYVVHELFRDFLICTLFKVFANKINLPFNCIFHELLKPIYILHLHILPCFELLCFIHIDAPSHQSFMLTAV